MKAYASNVPAAQLWRIPRVQYERMVDAGAFGPEDRVKLLKANAAIAPLGAPRRRIRVADLLP